MAEARHEFRELERRLDRLQARAEDAHREYLRERKALEAVRRFLELAPGA